MWEWCQDFWDCGYYASSPAVDPENTTPGSGRVSRGGSWSGGGGVLQSAYRGGLGPSIRGGALGFRPARVIP